MGDEEGEELSARSHPVLDLVLNIPFVLER